MTSSLYVLLLVLGAAHGLPRSFLNGTGKVDEACTSIGGTCMDWRYNRCTAGYQVGLCSGDTNNRCCQPCDATCLNNEASWSSGDAQCTAAQGTCMMNSNYCDGSYTSGKCGGPANRQCCQKTGCPSFITRAQWGARSPTSVSTIGNNLAYQFVHHAETNPCSTVATCSAAVRSIQNYHMDTNGWSDIGYSFLVGGDGNIYEGRGWNVLGAHTSGYNSVGYGTCFIGSFMTSNPVPEAQDIYLRLLDCAVASGKVASNYKMYGHRQAGSTDCPGDSLYQLIQSWPHWTAGSPA